MGSLRFAGISKARARLQQLADGLRDAAGGGVLARAAAKVQQQIDAVAHAKTSAHMATGAADASIAVTAAGGLVQLKSAGYLRYHAWWPFRRGMPPFVVKRAAVILARELLSALGGKPGGELAAEVVAEEDAAVAGRAAKKLERRLDRATKRREAKG